jgi:hypothetical protein
VAPAIVAVAVAVAVSVFVVVAFPLSSCVYKHTEVSVLRFLLHRDCQCYYEAFKGANDREHHISALSNIVQAFSPLPY